LPRATIRDINYEGVRIPKGTVIFLNAWACNMGKQTLLPKPQLNSFRILTTPFADPDIWTDPEVFRPERFLEKPDAPLFTYGLGYRMCAGSILANRELYLIFMRLLNSFAIEKADDVDVHPVRGNADPTSLVAMPKRYEVKFVPRNEMILRETLRSEAEKNGD
jgi:3-hydroxyphenylacetate 6-hydroxylase